MSERICFKFDKSVVQDPGNYIGYFPSHKPAMNIGGLVGTKFQQKFCIKAVPRPRTDRFVAPRSAVEELRWRRHGRDPSHPPPQAIWTSSLQINHDVIKHGFLRSLFARLAHSFFGEHSDKYMRQKKFTSHIDWAFGLAALGSDQPRPGWPCIPRTRRHLSSADYVLDLPAYSWTEFSEIIDWSKDNILVAALGKQYYKLSWPSQSPVGNGFTQFVTTCCRFDPTGERLALGTDMRLVEVHNSWSKWVASGWCRCQGEHPLDACLVTAVDWSPTGNSFVIGCSRGVVSSFDRDGRLISHWRASEDSIFIVKVSPDARYVAAAAVNAAFVQVMLWPTLEDPREIGSNWTVKTIAWHPWRSALLGIGGMKKLKIWIAMWDAPRATITVATTISRSSFTLDTMLFSHRTGELLLSLSSLEQPLMATSQLVVMSGPDAVVDQWGDGQQSMDRVRAMVFNSDGTKLATATNVEDLIIWNFLPQNNQPVNKAQQRKFFAIATYIDETMHGFSLR